jgi:hypothetical protein
MHRLLVGCAADSGHRLVYRSSPANASAFATALDVVCRQVQLPKGLGGLPSLCQLRLGKLVQVRKSSIISDIYLHSCEGSAHAPSKHLQLL